MAPNVAAASYRHVSLSDLQATSQDSNGDLDDEESEYDIMMMENAGEVIPSVAKLVSPQEFCSYLVGLLPELLRRTVSQLIRSSSHNNNKFNFYILRFPFVPKVLHIKSK